LFFSHLSLAQTFQWVKTIGSNKEDQITSIAASNDGFVYLTGNFQDTIDLDNGPGVYPLISSTFSYYDGQFDTTGGDRQLFLAKYTSDGQIVWGKQFGGSYLDFAGILKLDNAGDILLTGSYYFSIDFNYSDTLNAFGISNAQNTFIAKFSPNGELIWDRRYESGAYLPEYDYDYTNFIINDIAFNDDNSMIICGSTTGQIDTYLNTGFNQNVINNRNTVFYQKLNSNGGNEYLKFIKGSSSTLFSSNIQAVSINQQGEFTLAGNFSDSLFINPDDPNYFIDLDSLSVQSTYGFFAHYTAAGVFQWSKSIIGGSALYNHDMVIDAYGNHYIAGEFAQPPNYLDTRPAIDFDPGPGQYNVPIESIGSTTSSAFLASYTPIGDFRWAFWMVSPYAGTNLEGAVSGNFLELDAAERLIFGGSLKSVILDIDPGPNVVSLQSEQTGMNGPSSPFIARYTTNGNYISYKQFRGAGTCWQTGLSLDSNGSIYTSGNFLGNYRFNYPNSLITSSTNYTNYNFPNDFSLALDGFFTKHQNCIQKTYLNQSICSGDSLFFNGNQLKYPGEYPRVVSSLNNCDQIEVLQLDVIPPISSSQNFQLCAGDSIQVGTQSFNQSGIYQTVFPASNGCDSLVTTHLTVDSLNAQISLSDNVFSAVNIPVDATYQWLDCESNLTALIGQINPTYTATENGMYALEINTENCRDTSECLLFNSLGLINTSNTSIQLFPNPADQTLFIKNLPEHQALKLFDATGRIVLETQSHPGNNELNVSEIQTGLYILRIGSFSKSILIHHSNP